MTDRLQGRIPQQEDSAVIRAITVSPVSHETYETIAPLRLSHALEYAMKAAIAGTGGIPKTHSTLQELYQTLRRLAPEEDLTTEFSIHELKQPTLLHSISIERLVESSTRYVNKFRKLATRLRTRTTRRANAALKPTPF